MCDKVVAKGLKSQHQRTTLCESSGPRVSRISIQMLYTVDVNRKMTTILTDKLADSTLTISFAYLFRDNSFIWHFRFGIGGSEKVETVEQEGFLSRS